MTPPIDSEGEGEGELEVKGKVEVEVEGKVEGKVGKVENRRDVGGIMAGKEEVEEEEKKKKKKKKEEEEERTTPSIPMTVASALQQLRTQLKGFRAILDVNITSNKCD